MSDKTDATLNEFKLKRKWQIALRRYVVDRQKSPAYAPYFGVDILLFRSWIESQFTEGLDWPGFGMDWQFTHVIPLSYFDFHDSADLHLCWNFLNVRVSSGVASVQTGLNLLNAKAYFLHIAENSEYEVARRMVKRIDAIERAASPSSVKSAAFVTRHINIVNRLATYREYEMEKLNDGVPFPQIEEELEMLRKFSK